MFENCSKMLFSDMLSGLPLAPTIHPAVCQQATLSEAAFERFALVRNQLESVVNLYCLNPTSNCHQY